MNIPQIESNFRELKSALVACGFGDFTVRPAEDGRQYRSLILAARKLE